MQMPKKPAEVDPRPPSSLAALLAALLLLLSAEAPATPLGSEFQINTTTLGSQAAPSVAAQPGGRFLVVWQSRFSPGDDSDAFSILGREVDATGAPVGGEQQINLLTTYSQRNPRVSSRDDGSFVVQWTSLFPGGKGLLPSLKARSFDADGIGADSELEVDVVANIFTTITQHDVAAATGGQFVTVFSDFYNDFINPYISTLQKKRFTSDGQQLESATLRTEEFAFLRGRIDGSEDGFVIVWMNADYLISQYSTTEAQRLDLDGASVGPSFSLHPELQFSSGESADVATVPGGEFMTVWNGYESFEGTSVEVYSRRVDVSDAPDPAGPRVINSYTTSFELSPRLARGIDGSFLVVWSALSSPDDEGRGLRGRFLEPDGTPRGDEFRVNTHTTGNQLGAEVEASDDGKTFLVVWATESGPGSDDDDFSISGQRFQIVEIFADGFESGDTARWTNTLP